MKSKKYTLLLAGGHFPSPVPGKILMSALEYVEREGEAGHRIQCDFPVFNLPLPDHYTKVIPITSSFWQSFPSESDYYEHLMENARNVIVLAFARAPDHRDRVNLISFLCDIAAPKPLPLSVHLF